MKIELAKEQYQDLLKMCKIADYVYGILGDDLPKDRLDVINDHA